MADVAGSKQFLEYSGPQSGVKYPITVLYCGECGVPVEYCEYYPTYEKCKAWLEKNLPDEFEKLKVDKPTPVVAVAACIEEQTVMVNMGVGEEETAETKEEGEEKKKRQTRGGKAIMKAKKKIEPQGVKLWTQTRGKKKKVTIIVGLASYEIDLKEASKFFAGKFSCGSSISGDDEIVVQGDVKDDLFDILPEKWKIIDEDDIEDCGEKK